MKPHQRELIEKAMAEAKRVSTLDPEQREGDSLAMSHARALGSANAIGEHIAWLLELALKG